MESDILNGPVLSSHIQKLPSDFTDVQSSTYDSEFISSINSQMQVPDRIAVSSTMGPLGDHIEHSDVHNMTVPERILVAGQNSHVGMRSSLQQFDFESTVSSHSHDPQYVNLMTPPRVLTVREQNFPIVEDMPVKTHVMPVVNSDTDSYLPGLSRDDFYSPNDEDDISSLRRQTSTLARRLSVVERENAARSQRELFLYPIMLGYFFIKVIAWFFRR